MESSCKNVFLETGKNGIDYKGFVHLLLRTHQRCDGNTEQAASRVTWGQDGIRNYSATGEGRTGQGCKAVMSEELNGTEAMAAAAADAS